MHGATFSTSSISRYTSSGGAATVNELWMIISALRARDASLEALVDDVDATARGDQATAIASRPVRDHLGEDRDGGLLGRVGTDVEAHRATHAGQVILAESVLAEPG